MDSRALLRDQLRISHETLKMYLSDLSDEDSRRILNATLPPIIWHVGHLVVMNAYFAGQAGATVTPAPPAEYFEFFKEGSGGKADYPALAAIVSALDQTHGALERAVAEAKLDAPYEGSKQGLLLRNFAELFQFVNNYRWYHIGAITALRAYLGKPQLPRDIAPPYEWLVAPGMTERAGLIAPGGCEFI